MSEPSLGLKVSWFLYQKGLMGVAKPDYLTMAKFGDEEWFKIAETLYKDNNLEGRNLALDQLLQSRNLKSHPKRPLFLKMLGKFLSKGILDERRRVAKYIDDNPALFSTTDDALYGPLMTAMRDGDVRIANTAESAIKKLRGEEPNEI